MNNKLEVGMLAIIVGAIHCPENIGKVVELISFCPAGQETTDPDGFEYVSCPVDSWIVGGNKFSSSFEDGEIWTGFNYSRVRSCFLVPIGGNQEKITDDRECVIDGVLA